MQKNISKGSTQKINTGMCLSPGKYHTNHIKSTDKKNDARKKRINTPQYKLKRSNTRKDEQLFVTE